MAAVETSADRTCPSCGTPRTTIDGKPQCPRCLLKLALRLEDDGTEEESGPASASGAETSAAQVGRYELLEELSRGGMGVVYRARQRTPSRLVAVKMLLPYLLQSEEMRSRFRTEAEAAASLDHPGILPIYEVGEQGNIPYFSMKLAEGGSLAQRIRALSGEYGTIARLLASVALAVHHAHGRGIVHRDLKPGNILFDSAGNPMVSDFGVAKWRTLDSNLTLPTSVLGSPHYMAPEQITGDAGRSGAAVNIYSLGAILYEALCGVPPIGGNSALDVIRRVPKEPPVPPRELAPNVPRGLAAIAMRCLEKDAARRYASAGELASDLERWSSGGHIRTPWRNSWRALTTTRTGRRAVGALATVLAVAGVSAATWVAGLNTPAPAATDQAATGAQAREPRTEDTATLLAQADELIHATTKDANDQGIKLLRDALELDPHLARAHAGMSRAYLQRAASLGEPRFWADSAIDEANKAIELGADDSAGYEALGSVFWFKNWYAQAADVLERGLQTPNSTGCSGTLSLVRAEQGRIDLAYPSRRRCVDVEPDDLTHPYLLAFLYYRLDMKAEGHAWLQRVIDRTPDASQAQLLMAERCVQGGDPACALSIVATLPEIQSVGGYTRTRMVRTNAVIDSGDYELALQLLEERAATLRAKGTDSVRPSIEILRAAFLEAHGDHDGARAALTLVRDRTQVNLDASSEWPMHFLRMSIAERLLGDRAAAYGYLAEARKRGWYCGLRCRTDPIYWPFEGDAEFAAGLAEDDQRLAAMRRAVREFERLSD